jgi:ATP-binding cassette subfamily B protein
VLIVLVLLYAQVQCDLMVPEYTKKLVDVGIQKYGIDETIPVRMSAQMFGDLQLFIPEDKIPLLTHAYRLENPDAPLAEQTLALGDLETIDLPDLKDVRPALEELLKVPLAILGLPATLRALPAETDPQMRAGLEEMVKQTNPELQRMAQAADPSAKAKLLAGMEQMIGGQMGDFAEQFLAAQDITAMREEYSKIGVDTDKIQRDYIIKVGAQMLGVSLAATVCAIFVVLLAGRAAAKIARKLRGQLYHRVLSFSRAELDKFSPASLVTRSTNDIQHIQMAVVMVIRIVLYAPMLGVGGVIKVINEHNDLSWILAVAVATLLAVLVAVALTVLPKFRIMQTLVDRLNLVSREILTGVPVIRAFSREKHEEERMQEASAALLKNQLFTGRAMAGLMPVFFFFINALTVVIVWFGAKGAAVGGADQLGGIMAFMSYTMQIVMSFVMLAMIFVFLPRAEVAAGRINEVLKTPPSVLDPYIDEDDGVDWKGEVAFDDVSFRFPGAEENVLEHISFTATPGQTTAILGGTGSGKSTLVQLIPRLYDVTEGSVTIDGVDVRALSQKKLRSLIGYIPQQAVLFSGTIESNLRFGSEDISEEELHRAARIAQAEDFILEKDDQYGSEIAQGGTNVSGGQRQRLAIARAIAKDPKLFVFDDSFSALDFKTDAALRHAIHTEISDAAVIIVAQRIATVLHADQILVLDEGHIVGKGTHSELMQSCAEYQEIARSQLSEEELQKGGVSNG